MAADDHLQTYQFEAHINKGGKLVPVSDQEYNLWKKSSQEHQDRYGAFSDPTAYERSGEGH